MHIQAQPGLAKAIHSMPNEKALKVGRIRSELGKHAHLRGQIRVVFIIVVPLDGSMMAEEAWPPHLTVLPLPTMTADFQSTVIAHLVLKTA